jgi:predicted DNA-binding protein (MmcQ/YjbR family)
MAYPGAEEIWEGSVGKPVWKVNGKIFAMQHPMGGQPSLWLKAPPGVQEALIGTDPERWFRPPYVGHNGWVGTWLDAAVPWPEIEDLVDDAYRMTAKKAQIRELDARREDAPGT